MAKTMQEIKNEAPGALLNVSCISFNKLIQYARKFNKKMQRGDAVCVEDRLVIMLLSLRSGMSG